MTDARATNKLLARLISLSTKEEVDDILKWAYTDDAPKKRGKASISVSQEDVDKVYDAYPSRCYRENNNVCYLRSPSDKDKIRRLLESGQYTIDQLLYAIGRVEVNQYTRLLSTFLAHVPDYGESKQAEVQTSIWQ